VPREGDTKQSSKKSKQYDSEDTDDLMEMYGSDFADDLESVHAAQLKFLMKDDANWIFPGTKRRTKDTKYTQIEDHVD